MFSVSKTCGSTDAGPFTIASNGRLLNVEMPSIRSNANYTVCYAPSSGSTFFPQSVTIKATGVVHKAHGHDRAVPCRVLQNSQCLCHGLRRDSRFSSAAVGPTQDIKSIQPSIFTVGVAESTSFTGATGSQIAFVASGGYVSLAVMRRRLTRLLTTSPPSARSSCANAANRILVNDIPNNPPYTLTLTFPNTGTYVMCEFVSPPNGRAQWFQQQATATVRRMLAREGGKA
jgi:hypothetical protein